jgi:hypothetical protein
VASLAKPIKTLYFVNNAQKSGKMLLKNTRKCLLTNREKEVYNRANLPREDNSIPQKARKRRVSRKVMPQRAPAAGKGCRESAEHGLGAAWAIGSS